MNIKQIDIFHLEECVWLAQKWVGVSAYDFSFEPLFRCRRPYQIPPGRELICRVGAFENYEDSYSELKKIGFALINNVEEHFRASELSQWYPLIEGDTPRSICYDKIPDVLDIERDFDYPVFIKGSRQTAKHSKNLSVAKNRDECRSILKEYQRHPILHWQQLVCREFVDLRAVEAASTEKVSPSYEFRSFWYKGKLVGVGHYWSEFVKYSWSESEKAEALALAKKVSDTVKVPFLVIDLAQTLDGRWIVIECNDGQESGYAGVEPIQLWNNVLKAEHQTDEV
ncbi:ATP-grasp domain-containing protein [Pleionea sp. CnH1-48]|uniref:ATP-grasp domain-containing protein n=1 Tax=Pleionea sp. CnH1-48 TaxID=2954494 RepID=UPI002096ADEB|nr:ATP-grasp domain-containing protein [Pleionea sp. CnH1-48]MCO7223375.1 ATP-grasp domain-containing protein [Pleionea sp. CnH1-48]